VTICPRYLWPLIAHDGGVGNVAPRGDPLHSRAGDRAAARGCWQPDMLSGCRIGFGSGLTIGGEDVSRQAFERTHALFR